MSNLGNKLKPCPFCNGKMKFYKITYINKYGKEITEQYYVHEKENSDCLLDELMMPFTIGAGDANPETGHIGEYAEKWNTRKHMDDIVEQLKEEKKMDRSKVYSTTTCTAIRFSFGRAIDIVRGGRE